MASSVWADSHGRPHSRTRRWQARRLEISSGGIWRDMHDLWTEPHVDFGGTNRFTTTRAPPPQCALSLTCVRLRGRNLVPADRDRADARDGLATTLAALAAPPVGGAKTRARPAMTAAPRVASRRGATGLASRFCGDARALRPRAAPGGRPRAAGSRCVPAPVAPAGLPAGERRGNVHISNPPVRTSFPRPADACRALFTNAPSHHASFQAMGGRVDPKDTWWEKIPPITCETWTARTSSSPPSPTPANASSSSILRAMVRACRALYPKLCKIAAANRGGVPEGGVRRQQGNAAAWG